MNAKLLTSIVVLLVVLAGCVAAPAATDGATTDDSGPDAPPGELAERVAADPTTIPPPIDRDEPAEVDVTLTAREVTAEVEDGVTYSYMTYDGQIPGPMVRVREGDTVNLTIVNPAENSEPHNVDFHATLGPGGGAEATTVAPGETAHLRFKVTYPGAYVYHCAVPNMDHHIASGMYGLILVEPADGMPEVDHEFYFGQNELYTDAPDDAGHAGADLDAMVDERPTYVLANGEKYAITDARHGAVDVETGETARVYFANGGPNLASSFHPIGNVWSELHPQGSLSTPSQTDIQTTTVPPGSAMIATMHFEVPGDVKLVDHSLSRVAHKGFMATIHVDGPENPELFEPLGTTSNGDATDADDASNVDAGGHDHGSLPDAPVAHADVGMYTDDTGTHFSEDVVWIEEGGTVTFELESGVHTATTYPDRIPQEAEHFDSGYVNEPGATYTATFEEEGVYTIYCVPHDGMGMITNVVVGNPDAADQPGLAPPADDRPAGAKAKIDQLNELTRELLEE